MSCKTKVERYTIFFWSVELKLHKHNFTFEFLCGSYFNTIAMTIVILAQIDVGIFFAGTWVT